MKACFRWPLTWMPAPDMTLLGYQAPTHGSTGVRGEGRKETVQAEKELGRAEESVGVRVRMQGHWLSTVGESHTHKDTQLDIHTSTHRFSIRTDLSGTGVQTGARKKRPVAHKIS